MNHSPATKDVSSLLQRIFGDRKGTCVYGQPSEEHFLPSWASRDGRIICDAPSTIHNQARGFASKEIYLPVTISPEATFFVYFDTHSYFVLCKPDANIAHIVEEIQQTLQVAT